MTYRIILVATDMRRGGQSARDFLILALLAVFAVGLGPADAGVSGRLRGKKTGLRRVGKQRVPASRLRRGPRNPKGRLRAVLPFHARRYTRLHPVLRQSIWQVRKLDHLVEAFRERNPHARIQLTGSTLYRVIGAANRPEVPQKIHDIDLRLYGLTPGDARKALHEVFPGEDTVIERAEPYETGIVHFKATVPRRGGGELKVDVNVYSPNKFSSNILDKAHQWVTFAKLKMEIPVGARASALLSRATDVGVARQMRVIKDPSGRGITDIMRGMISINFERGMNRQRRLEGLLHSIYLYGKLRFEFDPKSAALFRDMSARDVRRFFERKRHGEELSRRRARYVINAFKPQGGRNVSRVLSLGREMNFWTKLIPELGPVIADDARWTQLVADVQSAHMKARSREGSRGYVFGAFLAPLSKAELEGFLKRFNLSDGPPSGKQRNFENEVRRGHKDFSKAWQSGPRARPSWLRKAS